MSIARTIAKKFVTDNKDLIYTTIRELYDDIKLAEIESPEYDSFVS